MMKNKRNSGETVLNGNGENFPKEHEEEILDPLFNDAVEYVFTLNYIGTSALQRKFLIGYTRANRILDELEKKGIISSINGVKTRRVILTKEEWKKEKMKNEVRY